MNSHRHLAPVRTRRNSEVLNRKLIRNLARFRYHLRRFLRFSEQAARAAGITPQQHQLLLGIAGYTDRESTTISELAEFLQERHNAVVGLAQRAAKRGLVRKVQGESDRRFVRVHLTARGEAVLAKLTQLHREEATRMAARLPATSRTRPIQQSPGT